MAVTASLVQVKNEDGRAVGVVLFTDGSTFKKLETFDLLERTEEEFKSQVENRRSRLERSVQFLAKATPGMDLTPTVATSTDLNPDRTAFLIEYRKLQALLRVVQSGILDAADKSVSDQLVLAKSLYKIGFIDVL